MDEQKKVPINYSGLHTLLESEQEEIKFISDDVSQKISRGLPVKSFDLNVKTAHKTGQRKLYFLELHARVNGKLLTTSTDNWELKVAVHKVFSEMKTRIEKQADERSTR